MHKFTIRRCLRLLLAAALCFGALTFTGAADGAEELVRPAAEPVLTTLEEAEEAEEAEDPAQPEEEIDPVQAAEMEARQKEAARLLAQKGLTKQQKEALSSRMGKDESLFRLLKEGELTRADLVYLSLPNGRFDRLDRYSAWAAEHPKDGAEEVVLQVNMDQDQGFYSLIWETADPSSLTVLVNKHYTLPAGYVPKLEALGSRYGSGSLQPEAAAAFRAMADAAREDGISLRSVSAYRSYATQKNTYNRYLKQNKQATVDTFSARPGHSEHQTGLALDINVASTKAHFENTPAFAWLKEHCAGHGFILRYDLGKEAVTGYRFEPWHYRYVGVEIAQTIMEQGITYEEYVARQPVW
ncbi:MAG: M15 family metallopeptidase [Lawsonibacter sp.]|nr:M15 family metallopeptidase [Lawsonibacter sp.]